MWKIFFKFIKLRPGRVITQSFGELDFSSDLIPLETIRALYESDFPYLEITPQGKAYLYGILPEITDQTPVVSEEITYEAAPELQELQIPQEKPVKAIRKRKNTGSH